MLGLGLSGCPGACRPVPVESGLPCRFSSEAAGGGEGEGGASARRWRDGSLEQDLPMRGLRWGPAGLGRRACCSWLDGPRLLDRAAAACCVLRERLVQPASFCPITLLPLPAPDPLLPQRDVLRQPLHREPDQPPHRALPQPQAPPGHRRRRGRERVQAPVRAAPCPAPAACVCVVGGGGGGAWATAQPLMAESGWQPRAHRGAASQACRQLHLLPRLPAAEAPPPPQPHPHNSPPPLCSPVLSFPAGVAS